MVDGRHLSRSIPSNHVKISAGIWSTTQLDKAEASEPDEGSHWVRVSDDDHRYGTVNVVEGNPRVFGRVYLGPSGRGIVVGEPRAD